VTIRAFLSPMSTSNQTQRLKMVLWTTNTALQHKIKLHAFPFWSQKSQSNAQKRKHLGECLSLSSWIAFDNYRCFSILSRSSNLNVSIINMLSQIILCGGGCPVHCGMFCSILGLHSLDASSEQPHAPKM